MKFSRNGLNNDLQKINNWALQWNMNFNIDPKKQERKVYFPQKVKKDNSLNVTINGYNTGSCSLQKYFVLVLNGNLKVNEHIQSKIIKCNKIISII